MRRAITIRENKYRIASCILSQSPRLSATDRYKKRSLSIWKSDYVPMAPIEAVREPNFTPSARPQCAL